MMFYLLSLITGILECGWVAYGVTHSLPLWQILCYPLAYHLGNLFPKPFSLSQKCLLMMSAISFVISSFTFAKQLSEVAIFIFTCVTLFLLSAVIQSVRSGLKSDSNRLMKRIFRVGGFALAPLAAIIPSEVLLISSAIAFYGLKGYKSNYIVTHLRWQNGFSLVMIFHQLHYFFYAHITLASMSLMLSHNNSMGIVYAALLFCGTWVTYMSVEPVVSKLTSKIIPVFYAGHIGISVLLFVMRLVTSKLLFVILWLITGFGGGVVYTISAKAKVDGSYDKNSMIVSENIGHTLGLLVAVNIAALASNQSPGIMLVFGSISAILAVVTMIFLTVKT